MMAPVRIPTKVHFDAMLEQLQLPKAIYSTHKARTIGLEAAVEFYPSADHLTNGRKKKSFSIYVSGTMEEAEDRLAAEAIKYMGDSHNKVLQDFNYDRLQFVQQKNESLMYELNEKDSIIEYVSDVWSSSLGNEHRTVTELHSIVETNFSLRSTHADNDMNHALHRVKCAAENLDDATLQAEDALQKINKYTWSLDDEFIEPEDMWAFTYDSPPRTPTMKNCLDDEMVFDTDATCSDN